MKFGKFIIWYTLCSLIMSVAIMIVGAVFGKLKG
jgi:hypothetical protein